MTEHIAWMVAGSSAISAFMCGLFVGMRQGPSSSTINHILDDYGRMLGESIERERGYKEIADYIFEHRQRQGPAGEMRNGRGDEGGE